MSKFGLFVLVALAVGMPAGAQEDVFIVNFPDVQSVEGRVSVSEPVPGTRMLRFADRIVGPVDRAETTSLVPGGVIEVDGFSEAVLSLAGFVQGQHQVEGKVGAVLIPDEDEIVQVFNEAGIIQLPLEVAAGVAAGDDYFAESEPVQLAFPRYQVYYYNGTDRAVSVKLFAYLSN